MLQAVRNAWKVPDLRKKILFTLLVLLIFRVGAAIPVPYIDRATLSNYLTINSGTIFGLINAMSGSAFSEATVFALSIQPYINASIIIQLLTVAIPQLETLQKEGGEEGKKTIDKITRYVTVAIALLQGFGYYSLIKRYNILDLGDTNGIWAGLVIVLCFTAGSAFLMWLGEQVDEYGVGNGISILLFAGIVSRVPHGASSIFNGVRNYISGVSGENVTTLNPIAAIFLIIGILAIIVLIVFITNSERRVPVQYAKRVVGRKTYGGQATHIPMKVNMAGVLPIIFAQAIVSLPATVGAFAGISSSTEGVGGVIMTIFDQSHVVYMIVYFLLIIAFSYFYSTMQFNPIEVANNLKKNGGFIPGFRPGKPTSDFLAKVLNKITMFGAIYLAIIAILPIIVSNVSNVGSLAIGGTSVVIVVGVALETVKAIEAQMTMRNYKGFLE